MDIAGKVTVITGAGSGIGAAIARRMAEAGARVMLSDLNREAAEKVAAEIGAVACACDVGHEAQIQALIGETEKNLGPVDVFVSNAGLGRGDPDHAASAPDADWDLNWRVHVMAHVWAARALLPAMIARGSGYFVNVASAAGLLNQIGDAAYSATKHAAVSFAESLAISHGREGIGVSVLCPQYVATPLIGLSEADAEGRETLLSADDVARAVMDGIAADRFLILSHPQVADYARLRAADHDKWIAGMQSLRGKMISSFGAVRPQDMYKLV
jgi:NAD(P)-dependent dehydrogenase (short-subunit alcohol dehydrogenase family)